VASDEVAAEVDDIPDSRAPRHPLARQNHRKARSHSS